MTLRALLLLFVGCAAVAGAYPPAPDDTLYGTVRAERGRVLAKGAARVIVSNDAGEIVSNDAGEIVRTPNDLAPEEGVNDAVHVPMDSGTVGAHDTPTALRPTVGFTLRILMGGRSDVPLSDHAPAADGGFAGDADTGWTSRLGSTVTTTSISNSSKLYLQSYSTAEN